MKASDWLKTLPENPGAPREQKMLDAVKATWFMPIKWVEIPLSHKTHSGILHVANDALQVGEAGDSVRITVTHRTAQLIADYFGCVLPTAKISDLAWAHAIVRLPALPQSSWVEDGTMAMTRRMVEQSKLIDQKLAGKNANSLSIATVGKDWVNTIRLVGNATRAANYGFHDAKARYQAATPIGGKLWQPIGLRHDLAHVDYSQSLRLVRATMLVDGQTMSIHDVARDPELCWLISSEGVLEMRHPGVPLAAVGGGGAQPAQATAKPAVETTVAAAPAATPVAMGAAMGAVPGAMPLFTRTLRLRSPLMTGDDVMVWQRVIQVKDDGVFGKGTEAATKAFQLAHSLVGDGVVGPQTRKAAEALLGAVKAPEGVALAAPSIEIPFVQAANYTKADRKEVWWLLLHSMEASEKPSTAEAVANWFAGKSGPAPQASAHVNIDCDSAVRSVLDEDIAWHAPGANRYGIGFEHAGYARQTTDEWLDDYSESMLWLSARLAKETCAKWQIPVKYIDAAGLLRGEHGITTHWDVTKAFKKGTHHDPGKGFPMERYLKMVNEA